MSMYKASSINKLLSKDFLNSILPNIKDTKIKHLSTNGLSGSKMYKLILESDEANKSLYLKVNNLKEDWLAKVSEDKGRELTIFKEGVYKKVDEFIKDIYLGYYEGNNSYAILMNDMSKYRPTKINNEEYFVYLDNLAKFHSKFKEQDVLRYTNLLDVEKYYEFLTKTKVNKSDLLQESNNYGWEKLKEFLGEKLYYKYYNLREIDSLFSYYPKTFLHGDYRPDNTLYINKDDIRIIDWANSGCGPCTLDLFWYLMTSVDKKQDKTELIDYYKKSLEKYIGYKFTNKTWNTLLRVGVLCSCKMYLAAHIGGANLNDKIEIVDIDYWVNSLKEVLSSL